MRRCALITAVTLAGASPAVASIPAADGTYTACVLRALGTVRVIDAAAQRCLPFELTITFGQGGSVGPALAQLQADLAAVRSELAATRADLAATRTALASLEASVRADLAVTGAALAALRAQVEAGATQALGGVLQLGAIGGRPVVRVAGADLLLDDGAALRGQGALQVLVEGDLATTVGGDASTTVGGSHTAAVGASLETSVGGDATLAVGGSSFTAVGVDRADTVGGTWQLEVQRDASLMLNEDVELAVGRNLTGVIGTDLDLQVGRNQLTSVTAASRTTAGTSLQLSSSGSAEVLAAGNVTLRGANGQAP